MYESARFWIGVNLIDTKFSTFRLLNVCTFARFDSPTSKLFCMDFILKSTSFEGICWSLSQTRDLARHLLLDGSFWCHISKERFCCNSTDRIHQEQFVGCFFRYIVAVLLKKKWNRAPLLSCTVLNCDSEIWIPILRCNFWTKFDEKASQANHNLWTPYNEDTFLNTSKIRCQTTSTVFSR